jgi:hypothetical protein
MQFSEFFSRFSPYSRNSRLTQATSIESRQDFKKTLIGVVIDVGRPRAASTWSGKVSTDRTGLN